MDNFPSPSSFNTFTSSNALPNLISSTGDILSGSSRSITPGSKDVDVILLFIVYSPFACLITAPAACELMVVGYTLTEPLLATTTISCRGVPGSIINKSPSAMLLLLTVDVILITCEFVAAADSVTPTVTGDGV